MDFIWDNLIKIVAALLVRSGLTLHFIKKSQNKQIQCSGRNCNNYQSGESITIKGKNDRE